MQGLVEQYQQEHDAPALEIAAALAKMSIGDRPLLLKPDESKPPRRQEEFQRPGERRGSERRKPQSRPGKGMERYRIEVGYKHDVKPGNIVGAIANEAGLDARHIGRIDIHTDFSLVDLPMGMPREVFQDLRKAWVCGQRLNISRLEDPNSGRQGPRKARKQKKTDA
jgi:ATP-dependent RNA helicase DeaD